MDCHFLNIVKGTNSSLVILGFFGGRYQRRSLQNLPLNQSRGPAHQFFEILLAACSKAAPFYLAGRVLILLVM
jgi:hypothetical protein